MRFKKNIISLIIIPFIIASCRSNKSALNREITTNVETETTTQQVISTEQSYIEQTSIKQTTENKQLDIVQTISNSSYERGTLENNIYTNKSLGFTFELPDNWNLLSLEQLNAISSAANGETIQEEDGVIYDLSVVSNDTGDGIQLVVGDLESSGDSITMLTPEIMAEIYKAQLSADGTEYIYKEPFNMQIANQDYYVLAVDNPTDNTSQWYMIRNNGKYIITFVGIFDTGNEEQFKTYIEMFKPINSNTLDVPKNKTTVKIQYLC